MDKLKACKLILILLIVSTTIVAGLIIFKYTKRYLNEQNIKEILVSIKNDTAKEINAEIDGYAIIRNIKDS